MPGGSRYERLLQFLDDRDGFWGRGHEVDAIFRIELEQTFESLGLLILLQAEPFHFHAFRHRSIYGLEEPDQRVGLHQDVK